MSRDAPTIAGNGSMSGREITPIGSVRWRTRVRVRGRIRSMRVQPWSDVASLECVVLDDTGGILVVFLGRRHVAGVDLGREIVVEGMVGESRGYLAMLNPSVELVAPHADLH